MNAEEKDVLTRSSEAAIRAQLVGKFALVTALIDWALKAVALAFAPESVVLNAEPFTLGGSLRTWVPVLLWLALMLHLPINATMRWALGLAVGGALANELESRLFGAVTDFIRPGLFGNMVYAPADVAMYAAIGIWLVGSAAWLARIRSHL